MSLSHLTNVCNKRGIHLYIPNFSAQITMDDLLSGLLQERIFMYILVSLYIFMLNYSGDVYSERDSKRKIGRSRRHVGLGLGPSVTTDLFSRRYSCLVDPARGDPHSILVSQLPLFTFYQRGERIQPGWILLHYAANGESKHAEPIFES